MDITDFEPLRKEMQGKAVVVRTHDYEFLGIWTRTVFNTATTECAVVLKTNSGEWRILVKSIESITHNYS